MLAEFRQPGEEPSRLKKASFHSEKLSRAAVDRRDEMLLRICVLLRDFAIFGSKVKLKKRKASIAI